MMINKIQRLIIIIFIFFVFIIVNYIYAHKIYLKNGSFLEAEKMGYDSSLNQLIIQTKNSALNIPFENIDRFESSAISDSDYDKIKKELESATNQNQNLLAQLKSLKNINDDQTKKIEELQSEIKLLKNEIQISMNKIKEIEQINITQSKESQTLKIDKTKDSELKEDNNQKIQKQSEYEKLEQQEKNIKPGDWVTLDGYDISIANGEISLCVPFISLWPEFDWYDLSKPRPYVPKGRHGDKVIFIQRKKLENDKEEEVLVKTKTGEEGWVSYFFIKEFKWRYFKRIKETYGFDYYKNK